MTMDKNKRRASRQRHKLKSVTSGDRARLSVFRSNAHIYAQIIDDAKGVTLASASTVDKKLRKEVEGKSGTTDAAAAVGKAIAERAKAAGVTDVYFDRGAFRYHGRVQALADAAREGGLNF